MATDAYHTAQAAPPAYEHTLVPFEPPGEPGLFTRHDTQLTRALIDAQEREFSHAPTLPVDPRPFDAPQFALQPVLSGADVAAQDPNVSNLPPYDVSQLFVSHEGNMALSLPLPTDRLVQADPGVNDAGASAPALNDGQSFHLPYPPVAPQSAPSVLDL